MPGIKPDLTRRNVRPKGEGMTTYSKLFNNSLIIIHNSIIICNSLLRWVGSDVDADNKVKERTVADDGRFEEGRMRRSG